MDGIKVRIAAPSDQAFLEDSWRESFRNANAAGPIPMEMYRTTYREVIGRLLQRAGVVAKVACNPRDEDQLYGFIVAEPSRIDARCGLPVPVLHYVFTKSAFRKLGVARALMKDAGVDPGRHFLYTFKSIDWALFMKDVWRAGEWYPFAARVAPGTPPKDL